MPNLKNILKTDAVNKSFYIPQGMSLTGTLTSDVPGQIAGAVNGDVIVNGSLIILESAAIIGNVRAQELEIWGRVTGYIQCGGKLILRKSAFVKGNIRTVEIHIEEDAVVDGIIFKPGHKKTEEEFVHTAVKETSLETVGETGIPTNEPVLNKVEDKDAHSWF